MCFRNIFSEQKEEAGLTQEHEDGFPKREKIMHTSAVSSLQ